MAGDTADGREGKGRKEGSCRGKQWNRVFVEEGEKRGKARNESLR